MDALIKKLLTESGLSSWLDSNGLGWLINDRVNQTLSILIGSLLAYYIGKFFITRGLRHVIRSTAKHRSWHKKDVEKRERTLVQLFGSFWRVAIIAYTAAMLANKLFGFDLSPLFASAGIIGVALGFGAQSLVRDFLAGIFIIAENQYRVGDIVDIMGSIGTVERVGTRSTVLRDTEGGVHYIPNGTITQVINKTMGYSVSRFVLRVDSETDISLATKIINSTGEQLASDPDWKSKIIEPPKFIAVGEITGQSIELTIAGKTQPSDQWSVTSEMRKRLLVQLEENGIDLATLPTPIPPVN